MTGIRRRDVILGGTAFMVVGSLAGGLRQKFTQYQLEKEKATLLSAALDDKGDHCLVGTNPSGKKSFCIPVEDRAHDIVCIPDSPLAVFLSRRPGTAMHWVDTQLGTLVSTVLTPAARHLYGHGVLSPDGNFLFTTENAFDSGLGMIGIYETRFPFRRVGEFNSGGVGPHQLGLLPTQACLVVANSGMHTHPESNRDVLNVDTMQPNLSYVDIATGTVLAQHQPPHHLMSVLHLSVTHNDVVVYGIQDQRAPHPDNVSPLIWQHQLGQAPVAMQATSNQWLSMQNDVGSVAVSDCGRWSVSTSPKGGNVSLWHLSSQKLLNQQSIKDVAGATWDATNNEFILSDGLGTLHSLRPNTDDKDAPALTRRPSPSDLAWDNHLSLVNAMQTSS